MKLLKLIFAGLLLGGSACGTLNQPTASNVSGADSFSMKVMNGDQAGQVFQSTDHESGIFVLEFYQDHCGPCNSNVPNVELIAQEYKSEERVQILDVGLDSSPTKYRNWIRKHNPQHPVVMDQGAKLFRALGMSVTPTMVILDCNMNELFRLEGLWTDSMDAIRTVLDQQLASECVRGA